MVKSFYNPKIEEKGRADGIEKGIKKSNELLVKLLSKRFGELPNELKVKIMSLPIEKINEIGEAIFDLTSIEDINKII